MAKKKGTIMINVELDDDDPKNPSITLLEIVGAPDGGKAPIPAGGVKLDKSSIRITRKGDKFESVGGDCYFEFLGMLIWYPGYCAE